MTRMKCSPSKKKAAGTSTLLLLVAFLCAPSIFFNFNFFQRGNNQETTAVFNVPSSANSNCNITNISPLPSSTRRVKNPALHYPPGRKYVVPTVQPVVGAHRRNVDAVFAMAKGYGIEVFLSLVGSLLETGYQGDIVLGIDRWNKTSPTVQTYLQYHGNHSHVIAYEIKGCNHPDTMRWREVKCSLDYAYNYPDPASKKDRSGRALSLRKFRFEHFWIWSRNYSPQSRILLVGSRDSIFQMDPFRHNTLRTFNSNTSINININMERQLMFFAEHPNKTLAAKGSTGSWITSFYGDGVLPPRLLLHNKTLCSGTTIGGNIALQQYLLLMVYEIDNIAGIKLPAGDQAHHNVLYYTGQLANQTGIDQIIVYENFEGAVATIGREVELGPTNYNQENKRVLGIDGEPIPILHQFDRNIELKRTAGKRTERRRKEAEVYLNLSIVTS